MRSETTGKSMTLSETLSTDDLAAVIARRRKEVTIIAQQRGKIDAYNNQSPDKDASDLGSIARRKLAELGMLEKYEESLKMTDEQKTAQAAQRENQRHGDLNPEIYDCPLCLNRGYIAKAEGTDIVRYKCKCMGTRRTIRRIKASGLEAAIDEYRFENFDTNEPFQRDMKDKAVRYLAEKGAWFMVCGQSGCGKTHICTAIVRQKIKHSHDVIYMPYRDEIVRIKQSVTDAEAYQKRMEQLKRVDTLYIDDLFKGKIGEADINAMYELLGYRYSNHLDTIISTEVSVDRIIAIDEAIAGRIYERCGKGEYVMQIGADIKKNYRLKKAG